MNKVSLVNQALESLGIQGKRVRKASQDSLEPVERRVRKVIWECQVNQVWRDQRERKAPLDFLVSREYQEKRELQGFQGLKEKQGLMADQVMLAYREPLVPLGRKEILVLMESQDPREKEESQAYLDKASLANLEQLEVKVIREVLAFLALLDFQVSLGSKVKKDYKAHKGFRESPERGDCQGCL